MDTQKKTEYQKNASCDMKKKMFYEVFSIALFFSSCMGIFLYFFSNHKAFAIFENSKLFIRTKQELILPMVFFSSLFVMAFIIVMMFFIYYLFLKKTLKSLDAIKKYMIDVLGEGDFSSQLFIQGDSNIIDLPIVINHMRKLIGSKIRDLKTECFAMQNIENQLIELWRPGKAIDHKKLEEVISNFKKQQRLIEEKSSSFFC